LEEFPCLAQAREAALARLMAEHERAGRLVTELTALNLALLRGSHPGRPRIAFRRDSRPFALEFCSPTRTLVDPATRSVAIRPTSSRWMRPWQPAARG